MPDVVSLNPDVRTSEDAALPAPRPIEKAWAALPFLIPAIVGLQAKMGATDLVYHLRAGEQLLNDLAIPRSDTYTFTAAGVAWVDQQWGAQAVVRLLYDLGGWPLLGTAQALLAGLTFSFVYLACRSSDASPRASSLLSIGGFVVSSPALSLRPQLLVLPLFAVILWLLAGRREHPVRLWWIPVAALVTANMHGSFPLYGLLVGLAWLDDMRRRDPSARRTLLIGVVSLVATLANPFGPGIWVYAYELSTNPVIRDTISEWAPITLAHIAGWFMVASGLAIAGYLARRREPVAWSTLVTLGVFFILAMAAQRAIVWWGLVAPVALASLLPAKLASATGADRREPALPAIVVVGSLMALSLMLLPWWRGSTFDRHLDAAPPGLTAAVIEQVEPGSRMMVHQPWGSWFEFAVPDVPVFVDTRIEIYTEAIWDDYGELGFSGARWRDVLERWDIEAIVADEDSWELIPVLREDSGWRVAYEDDDGVLFLRV